MYLSLTCCKAVAQIVHFLLFRDAPIVKFWADASGFVLLLIICFLSGWRPVCTVKAVIAIVSVNWTLECCDMLHKEWKTLHGNASRELEFLPSLTPVSIRVCWSGGGVERCSRGPAPGRKSLFGSSA